MSSDKSGIGGLTSGAAYYTRETWTRLRELYPKDHTLDKTYEDWQEGVNTFLKNSLTLGLKIEPVWIEIDDLVRWCEEKRLPMNSSTRSQYVVYKLDQLDLLRP
jgi:hypothetical protein